MLTILFFLLLFGVQNIESYTINIELRKVYASDQMYRNKIDSLSRCGASYDVIHSYLKKQIELDSINVMKVVPLVNKILARNLWELEDISYKACFLVIHHSDLDLSIYKEFIGIIHQKGYISSIEYAMFIDREHIQDSKAQIYGTQSIAINNELYLYPITEGYKTQWRIIGEKFPRGLHKDFKHGPVILGEEKFCLIVVSKTTHSREFRCNGTTIYVGKEPIYMLMNKADLPKVYYIGKEKYDIVFKENADFLILKI